MDFVKIIDSIEKIFRYFLTGIAFSFIYHLSIRSSLNIPTFTSFDNIIYLYILAVGMTIYSIHRVIYWSIIDFFILFLPGWSPLSNFRQGILPIKTRNPFKYVSVLFKYYRYYSEALGEFHKKMAKDKNTNVTNYLFYRLSIIHFCLILSEITWLLYPFSNDCSILVQNEHLIIPLSIIIWVISFINYISSNIASKRIYR